MMISVPFTLMVLLFAIRYFLCGISAMTNGPLLQCIEPIPMNFSHLSEPGHAWSSAVEDESRRPCRTTDADTDNDTRNPRFFHRVYMSCSVGHQGERQRARKSACGYWWSVSLRNRREKVAVSLRRRKAGCFALAKGRFENRAWEIKMPAGAGAISMLGAATERARAVMPTAPYRDSAAQLFPFLFLDRTIDA